MAFLVCLLLRESIGVAITKSFVIFVRKFFVSSLTSRGNRTPGSRVATPVATRRSAS